MAVLEMLGAQGLATRLGWERKREGREDDRREGGRKKGGKGRGKEGKKKVCVNVCVCVGEAKKQRKQNTHNSHLSFRGQHVPGGIV